ncbi:MAG: hypothetical protein JXB88_10530 [Spirochaetales bacterium]|nr:hypothetical protein [Spirochaetales bacterium]
MVFNIPKQTHNRAAISATGNIIILEGDIDHNDPEVFIKPFLEKILSNIPELLIIDIRNLEFLNSSGIKCLLDFLKAKPPHYKVIVRTDKKKTWQHKSMTVIQSLDKDNIYLEDVDKKV